MVWADSNTVYYPHFISVEPVITTIVGTEHCVLPKAIATDSFITKQVKLRCILIPVTSTHITVVKEVAVAIQAVGQILPIPCRTPRPQFLATLNADGPVITGIQSSYRDSL